jgi:hypothetical protein
MSDFETPIQNLDAVDIIGERLDGGVDLVVVCSGPLDDSADTLGRLNQKVRNYLREVASENFRARFGIEAGVAIFVSCAHPVSGAAGGLINVLRQEASAHGVGLQLVKDSA